jgi:hypothetical protein
MIERKEIERQVCDELEIYNDYASEDDPVPIDSLIEYLLQAKQEGATEVKIFSRTTPDGDPAFVEFYPYSKGMETDEEFEDRKREVERSRKMVGEWEREREMKLYNELKEKYEDIDTSSTDNKKQNK